MVYELYTHTVTHLYYTHYNTLSVWSTQYDRTSSVNSPPQELRPRRI